MLARVAYLVTAHDYYVVASEVATIEVYLRNPCSRYYYLRVLCRLEQPRYNLVYSYGFRSRYQNCKLSDVCPRLGDQDVVSIVHQLTQLESQMMPFAVIPRGREPLLYQRPRKVVPGLGVPLEDRRFYGGTDTKLAL